MQEKSSTPRLSLEPIGYLQAEQEKKFELPPQPGREESCQGIVHLCGGKNYEVALRDLDGFSRIWLVWWFHKNDNWKPTTLPPRGRSGRKGTFSTRSPYRPNPLALSCVELLGIEEEKIYIGAHDLLDGTPILDIKPYIPEFDSFPQARTGWYGEMQKHLAAQPLFAVEFSKAAESSLPDASLREKVETLLSKDPYPHRTRRIVEYESGYRLSCGDWRVFYQVHHDKVVVDRVQLRDP